MTLKVMVIDDSQLVLSVVRSFLESAGHLVVTRAMAVGTRAAVLRERPDVIVLDVNMPLLEGDEICTSIRQHERMRGTLILLHSDRPEPELRRLAQECGANGHICKTSDRERFLRPFDALVRSRAAETFVAATDFQSGYILAACSSATQARLRAELVSSMPIEYTDSGTEALRRVFSRRAPEVLLLGTSLIDMGWDVVRVQAAGRDARYSRRTLLIREDADTRLPGGVAAWDARQSVAELEARLARVAQGGAT